MAENSLIEGLIDKKIVRILKLFLDNKDELFHINKISSQSNVPLSTTFRIVKKLAKIGFIKTITVGKFDVYMLNESKKTELLGNMLK